MDLSLSTSSDTDLDAVLNQDYKLLKNISENINQLQLIINEDMNVISGIDRKQTEISNIIQNKIHTEDGHTYLLNKTVKSTNTTYYHCQYKSKGCKSTLKRHKDLYIHGRETQHSNHPQPPITVKHQESDIVNQKLEELTSDYSKSSYQIYEELLEWKQNVQNANIANKIIEIPSQTQVIRKVNNTRRRDAKDLHSVLLEDTNNCTKQQKKLVKQIWTGLVKEKYEKIVVWGVDQMLTKMKVTEQLFIDATFKISPKGYYQVLIIMLHCKETNSLMPCLFIAMTGKSEEM